MEAGNSPKNTHYKVPVCKSYDEAKEKKIVIKVIIIIIIIINRVKQ